MFKNRNVFICTHYGWEVISDGSDGKPVRIQYRPDGKINGYYDRKRPEQALTCVIEAEPEKLPEEVNAVFENFDASAFAWQAAKEYEAKYETVPPVVSFADYAKQIFSSLEKLNIALKGNQHYDAFEMKMAEAAAACGFDMMIERGRMVDTLHLTCDEASFSTVFYKTYSEKEDTFVPGSDAERLKELRSNTTEDVRYAGKKPETSFLLRDIIRETEAAAEKGMAFLAAMEENGTA